MCVTGILSNTLHTVGAQQIIVECMTNGIHFQAAESMAYTAVAPLACCCTPVALQAQYE